MTTIITGFKTIQDVEKTLKWIEKNTKYEWICRDSPTKFTGWKKNFEEYQNVGGFVICCGEHLGYTFLNLYKNNPDIELISFKTLINQEEIPQGMTIKEAEEIFGKMGRKIKIITPTNQ